MATVAEKLPAAEAMGGRREGVRTEGAMRGWLPHEPPEPALEVSAEIFTF